MSKKKTHAEYVEELTIKNPDIEVIGIYMGNKVKIPHRCKKDGYVWDAKPTNILSGGTGCPMCAGNIKLTHEEYVRRVTEINSNIEVIGKYCNYETKIQHRCKLDGTNWNAAPNNILHGNGCPTCGNRKKSEYNFLTHDEYVSKLKKINQDIEVIGAYLGSKIKIPHKCKIDGNIWDSTPENILQGHGCPVCAINKRANKKRMTHEEYVERLSIINPNIEAVENYNCANNKIMHHCLIHNIYWETTPASVLNGEGCYECGRDKRHKSRAWTHDKYVKELHKVNPNIEVIGTYVNASTPILHKCLIDNYEWMPTPTNLLRGTCCPKCSGSKGELKISEWLNNNNILYIQQMRFNDCKNKNTLPFDFYIPSLNVAIEYDGIQHYEPVDIFGGQEQLKIQQKNDNIKNEYCKNNGISLLRIPYYKYNNIEEELNNFLFI